MKETIKLPHEMANTNVEIMIDSKSPSYYSTIYTDEQLVNPKSQASAAYHPVMVKDPDDMEMYQALFTSKEIDRAVERFM